jgi:ferric-dicitrate binding protein FerR (iron transport regulator)
MSQKEYQTFNNFLNGKLDENERKKITESINNFNSNNMKMEENVQFDAEFAWNKFQKRIQNSHDRKNIIHSISHTRFAASILMFFAISVISFLTYKTIKQNSYVEIFSGNDLKEIVLDDGSIITLNSNASLKFPKLFSNQNRTVELTGEAFFEVAKNPKKPFIIKTGNAKIEVLGTSFNVENKHKDFVRVFVETGKVQLSNLKDNKILLTSGEEGILENNRLSETLKGDRNSSSWKTKRFVYDNVMLSKVIEDFNKAYKSNIVFENELIGQKRIISQELHEKTLNTALTIICIPLNLEFHTENNKIIITEKK